MTRINAKYENGICTDIEIKREKGLPVQILGSGGKERELAILPQDFDPKKHLPVFLGHGMGFAVREFAKKYPDTPFALIDKEQDILNTLNFSCPENCFFVCDPNKQHTLSALTKWQGQNQNKPFFPIVHPFYQRLDRDYYGYLREQLTASQKFNFWDKARYAKFQNSETKLILISSKYFLIGEVETACKNLGIQYHHIRLENEEMAHSDFVRQLLEEIISFKPDALLTLNHLGVDREGVLMDLLNRLELPFISWFLDNPHLVLYSYQGLTSPFLHIFTWDKDNIQSLKAKGFDNVYYLPLGTDIMRFNPQNREKAVPSGWKSDVSFVGNSMIDKVQKRWEASTMPENLYGEFLSLSEAFIASPERIVENYLQNEGAKRFPQIYSRYLNLETEEKLAFETAITWEATRLYRLNCVKQTLDFAPLLLGDEGWKVFLADEKRKWSWHPPVAYYDELPYFYPHSLINFNCTSMQMKGASNQRILDVPACGAFVLTDYREQMEDMFDIGKEIICYRNTGEIPELIRYYLTHDKERAEVAEKGRKRVAACHTWTHRMQEIIKVMKERYAKNQ